MNKCYKCNIRIVKHLWVHENNVYCSPLCIRGKDSRYGDKMVRKIGCAGLKKNQ